MSLYCIIEEVFSNTFIPWSSCTALYVDSPSVNVGKCYWMKTWLEAKNPSLHTSYNYRCPCHFLSNAVHKLGSKDIEPVSVFDLEEIHEAVDVFYYFDHSSKEKSQLQEFVRFCNIEHMYWNILKYILTDQFSLQTSLEWINKECIACSLAFCHTMKLQEHLIIVFFTCREFLMTNDMQNLLLLFYQSFMFVFTKTKICCRGSVLVFVSYTCRNKKFHLYQVSPDVLLS